MTQVIRDIFLGKVYDLDNDDNPNNGGPICSTETTFASKLLLSAY